METQFTLVWVAIHSWETLMYGATAIHSLNGDYSDSLLNGDYALLNWRPTPSMGIVMS